MKVNAGEAGREREPSLGSGPQRTFSSPEREEAIFHCYPKLYKQTHAVKNISPPLQGVATAINLVETFNCHKFLLQNM